jgi:hypothetical protein
MSEAKHTPGPLHMRPSTYEPEAFDIVAPNIGAIGIVKHVADAARIVKCVNSHDELIAALQYIATGGEDWNDCVRRARAAVSRALDDAPPQGEK